MRPHLPGGSTSRLSEVLLQTKERLLVELERDPADKDRGSESERKQDQRGRRRSTDRLAPDDTDPVLADQVPHVHPVGDREQGEGDGGRDPAVLDASPRQPAVDLGGREDDPSIAPGREAIRESEDPATPALDHPEKDEQLGTVNTVVRRLDDDSMEMAHVPVVGVTEERQAIVKEMG